MDAPRRLPGDSPAELEEMREMEERRRKRRRRRLRRAGLSSDEETPSDASSHASDLASPSLSSSSPSPSISPSDDPISAWASLARDLLAPLFAAVLLRPRLLVLSLVCKRWRAVALSIPAALPALRPTALRQALTLLPHVTSLRDLPSTVAAPPAALRELHLPANTSAKERQLACLASLTALSVDVRSPRTLIEALLPPHRISALSGVTSLTLLHGPESAEHWPSGCLPRLALSIHHTAPIDKFSRPDVSRATQHLLTTHSSTLTSLRISHPALAKALRAPEVCMPLLRHLHWPRWFDAGLTAAAPNVQTYGLRPSEAERSPWPSAALVELDLSGLLMSRPLGPLAFYVPDSVHTLAVRSLRDFRALDTRPSVHSLELGQLAPAAKLYSFPSLTRLAIRQPCTCVELSALAESLSNWAFPLLRTLSVGLIAGSAKDAALRSLVHWLGMLEKSMSAVSVRADGSCEELRQAVARFRWLDVEVTEPARPRVR